MTGYCPTIVTSPRHVYQKLLPLLCRFCFVLNNDQFALLSPLIKYLSKKALLLRGHSSFGLWNLKYLYVIWIIMIIWKSLYTSLRTSGWWKLKRKWNRILPRRDGGPKGAALLGVHLEVSIFLPSMYQIQVRPLFLSGTSVEQSTPGRSQATHRIQNLLSWQSFNTSSYF